MYIDKYEKMMLEFQETYDDIAYDNGGELEEDFDYNKCYMEWRYPGILEEMAFVDKMHNYE